jgi:hypothetical protein
MEQGNNLEPAALTASIGSKKSDLGRQIQIDKAAVDHGFDLTPQHENGWLRYRSTSFAATVWVQTETGDLFRVGCDNLHLLSEASRGNEIVVGQQVHSGLAGVVSVFGYSGLYRLFGRIAALAQTLPTSLLDQFTDVTKALPKSTEAERLIVQRIGQSLFRNALIDYWEGRCPVTGLDIVSLLRASHIKPWAKCASDHERLDVYNGFLLAPQLDAMFDDGWCTFSDDGVLILSPQLTSAQILTLGIHGESKLTWIAEEHIGYLAYHRDKIFRAH